MPSAKNELFEHFSFPSQPLAMQATRFDSGKLLDAENRIAKLSETLLVVAAFFASTIYGIPGKVTLFPLVCPVCRLWANFPKTAASEPPDVEWCRFVQ